MGKHVTAGEWPDAVSSLRERAAVCGSLAAQLGVGCMIWCVDSPLFGPAIAVMMAGTLTLMVSSRLDRGYLTASRIVRVLRGVPIPLWLSMGLYVAATIPLIAGILYIIYQRG